MMPGNCSTRCNRNNGKKRSVRENPVLQERDVSSSDSSDDNEEEEEENVGKGSSNIEKELAELQKLSEVEKELAFTKGRAGESGGSASISGICIEKENIQVEKLTDANRRCLKGFIIEHMSCINADVAKKGGLPLSQHLLLECAAPGADSFSNDYKK
jgi:hypothetical protein